MKLRMISAAFAAGALLATAAWANDDIKERQELMETIGDQAKIIGPMLQGKAPFDAAKAKAAASAAATAAAAFPNHFPAGSETGNDTEALPIVWTQFDDFKAKSEKFAADAAAAATAADAGEDAFKAAAGAMFSNCKGCHEVYRKPS